MRLGWLMLLIGVVLASCGSGSLEAGTAAPATPDPADSPATMPGELLIGFGPGVSESDATGIINDAGGELLEIIPGIEVYRARFAAERPLDEVIDDLEANPDVKYAEPNGNTGRGAGEPTTD